jgi:hypothetical protein
MKNSAKDSERLTELLKKADNHPIVQKIIEEEAAKILEKRKETAAKIQNLEKESNEVMPRLQADLTAKKEQFKKAKETYDAATTEFNKAKATLSSHSFTFSHQNGLLKDILLETADPKIDEAIQFFNDKLKFLRDPSRIHSHALGAEKNFFSMKKKVKAESNYDAVISAMRYCQESIKALEAMRLIPKLDPEKIEALKNGIPNIDIYTESVGEKRII